MFAEFDTKGCTASIYNPSEYFSHTSQCKVRTELYFHCTKLYLALQSKALCCDSVLWITHSGLEDVRSPAALFDCVCLAV